MNVTFFNSNFSNYSEYGFPDRTSPQQESPKNDGSEPQAIFKRKNDSFEKTECQTCENRRYQDRSNDSSVSMQSPTKINPNQAASAVMAHEAEHVRNEQTRAGQEGREVVSQLVRLINGVCGECGKSYVAGGETTTVTKSADSERFDVGIENNPTGDILDTVA